MAPPMTDRRAPRTRSNGLPGWLLLDLHQFMTMVKSVGEFRFSIVKLPPDGNI